MIRPVVTDRLTNPDRCLPALHRVRLFVVVGADPLWRNVAGKPDPVLGAVELVPAVVHRGGIDHQDERAPAAGAYRGSGGGVCRQVDLVALPWFESIGHDAGQVPLDGPVVERGGWLKRPQLQVYRDGVSLSCPDLVAADLEATFA